MTGRKPIVIAANNRQQFHEHYDLEAAKQEASRLAEKLGGELVVYVPVAIVKPAPRTVTETIDDFQVVRYEPPF